MSSICCLTAIKNDGTILSMEKLRNKIIHTINAAYMQGETDPGCNELHSVSNHRGPENLVILEFLTTRVRAGGVWGSHLKSRFRVKLGFPTDSASALVALESVKDGGAPEVWKFLRDSTGMGCPRWIFSCKFLVNREGRVSVPQGNMIHEIAWLL